MVIFEMFEFDLHLLRFLVSYMIKDISVEYRDKRDVNIRGLFQFKESLT